nr:hypothetical protein [uncultured Albidiferax sp.]
MTISVSQALYVGEPIPHAAIFAAVAIFGFFYTVFVLLQDSGSNRHKSWAQVLVALWVLGPPLWFFYEHFYYFPAFGNMSEGAGFEKLKAAQDVTSKLWAAMAVVLGALYNRKFGS